MGAAIGDLISPAYSSLALSEPGHLRGEANGRTKIVFVNGDDDLPGIGGVGSDKFNLCQLIRIARRHGKQCALRHSLCTHQCVGSRHVGSVPGEISVSRSQPGVEKTAAVWSAISEQSSSEADRGRRETGS